jgi:hypothetical protein
VLDLPAGATTLEAWFGVAGQEVGAYYAYVDRVPC